MAPAFALLVAPLVAHAPELLGWASSNPAFIVSGLGVLPGSSPLPALPGWIDPNAGFTVQALGGLAARDWLGGHAPWWNPYDGVGLPLAAEAQNGGMFLPFVLLLRLFDGVLYFEDRDADGGRAGRLGAAAPARRLALGRLARRRAVLARRHVRMVRPCADPADRLPAAVAARHRARRRVRP